MRSNQSLATDIKPKVREEVKQRDFNTCVYCGRKDWLQLCHVYVNRSHGGLGVRENLVTLCVECHHNLDFGKLEKSQPIRLRVESYLKRHYGEPDMSKLKYMKGFYAEIDAR